MSAHPQEIDLFAAKARAFIEWCNADHAQKNRAQMQMESLQQLSQLYAAALRLPGVDFHPAPDPPPQNESDRARIAEKLSPLPFQYYWEVFTPTDMHEKEREPVCGDLFDDFQDICGDIGSGLWLYNQRHVEAAVFSWSQMFYFHWGRHAVSAMHALHSFDSDVD